MSDDANRPAKGSKPPHPEAARPAAAAHRPAHEAWSRVVLWVLLVGMLLAAGLYVFRSVLTLPERAARAGERALDKLATVASEFQQGTIETRFVSYAADISGTTYLQFATLRQTEVYTREDSSSVLWGRLALPDVVVAATAPVEYTYYLDLDDDWTFDLRDGRLYVHAPAIRFNRPSIDASEIHFDVRASSVLRDEEAAIEALKGSLSELAEERAAEHVSLIRETGRRKIEGFVATWLAAHFGDADDYSIEIVFPDEATEGEPGSSRPPLPAKG